MKWSNLPNIITIARFLLVAPVVLFQIKGMYAAALASFIIAGASDGLDGFLAKKFNWVSRLGSLLDPLADKTLLISVCVVLAWQQFIPIWLLALIIGRDIFIFAGAISYQTIFGKVEMAPRISSKINTFCQILMVIAILFSLTFWTTTNSLNITLQYLVATTVIISGVEYIVVWGQLARQRWRTQRDQ